MIKNLLPKFSLSLEELADGKTKDEIELVFYAKIVDFKELEKAISKEFQEQWEIKVPKSGGNITSGTLRVRRVDKDNKKRYILTAKAKTLDFDRRLENSVIVDEDMFDIFSIVATSGMRKMRFNFPVPDTSLVFEVDVFYDDEGNFSEYCKIDLEIPESLKTDNSIPEFPIQLTEVIEQKETNTEEEKSRIRELYDTVFLTTKRNNDIATLLEKQ